MNNQVTEDEKDLLNGFSNHEIGDDHLFTGLETPMKKDAFKVSDQEKKKKIARRFDCFGTRTWTRNWVCQSCRSIYYGRVNSYLSR